MSDAVLKTVIIIKVICAMQIIWKLMQWATERLKPVTEHAVQLSKMKNNSIPLNGVFFIFCHNKHNNRKA